MPDEAHNGLVFQWRAFGPKNNCGADSAPQLNIGSGGITVTSYADPDPEARYPYGHPVFSRFTNTGHLVWSRGTQSEFADASFGDSTSHVKIAFDGSILFTGSCGLSGFQYGKISNVGDLHFIRPVNGAVPDAKLKSDGDFGMLIQEGSYPELEPFRIVELGNPPSVLIPTVFDPQPQDVVAVEGRCVHFDGGQSGKRGVLAVAEI